MKPAPRTILHPDLYPGTTQKDAKAEALRKRANEAYANGDFEAALTKYSESALHDPTEATTWSNRSATLLQLDRAEDAFDDGDCEKTCCAATEKSCCETDFHFVAGVAGGLFVLIAICVVVCCVECRRRRALGRVVRKRAAPPLEAAP